MSTPQTEMNNDQDERKELEFVDVNDPNFVDGEELGGFDDTKDPLAYSVVRAGVHTVELDFSEQDTSKRWVNREGKNGDKYLSTRITGRILDGPFANRFVNDGFVSTMVFDGTCGVAKVIRGAGGDIKGARSSVELARRLSQLLPARAKVRSQVRAYERGVNKPFIKSERDFPQKDDGTPDFDKVAQSEGPEHGEEVFIRSEIVAYIDPSK